MDLSFTDDQRSISELAANVFGREIDVDRIRRVEATEDTVDHQLWATLAETGLLGVSSPDDVGGTGGAMVELCCLLEQQGRTLAPVPLARTLVAAMTIAEFGDQDTREVARRVAEGAATIAVAADLSGRPPTVTARADGDGRWRLDGTVTAVAGAKSATACLVVAGTSDGERLFLTAAGDGGVSAEATRTTNQLAHAHLDFDGAAGQPVGGAQGPAVLRLRLRVALAAVALGVAEESVGRAAAFTSQRHQFGKPLSSFQAAAHRAADCYIDVEAMRATLWQAAWRIDQNDVDAEDAALVAAWWAADAGPRVVQSVQHLHGGLGADIDYPIHRFYLWGTQLDVELGGASALLAQLGDGLARQFSTRTPTSAGRPGHADIAEVRS